MESLEDPVPDDKWLRNGDYTTGVNPPGWRLYSENTTGDFGYGVWNPTRDDYPGLGSPEGYNVGYIDIGSTYTGVVGFEQMLSADLTANTTYWLQVEVGNTLWSESPTNYVGFPGYEIQLLAGGTVIASSEDSNPSEVPNEGAFLTSTVSYAVDGGPIGEALLGAALAIRLLNLNLETGDGREVDFDDVRLTAAPIATLAAPPPFQLRNLLLCFSLAPV